jgi:hypothetical protein
MQATSQPGGRVTRGFARRWHREHRQARARQDRGDAVTRLRAILDQAG